MYKNVLISIKFFLYVPIYLYTNKNNKKENYMKVAIERLERIKREISVETDPVKLEKLRKMEILNEKNVESLKRLFKIP